MWALIRTLQIWVEKIVISQIVTYMCKSHIGWVDYEGHVYVNFYIGCLLGKIGLYKWLWGYLIVILTSSFEYSIDLTSASQMHDILGLFGTLWIPVQIASY